MIAAKLRTEALPALVAGTARRRPDFAAWGLWTADDPKADLKAAALLAQALRLERPVLPDLRAVHPREAGRRRPLPEALRAPVLRLVGPGRLAVPPADPLATGLALALERTFLAPHPYDFHRLEPFLRAHADRLGADVQAWLERDRPPQARQSCFDVPALTDETWRAATPAGRQRYIAERRLADPAGARALVAAAWADEGAELRLQLLGALRTRLGPEDRPFLEGLAGDRAPKVRDLADRLLSLLPGPDGAVPAHAEALGRIRRSTAGLLHKQTVLSLELPATVAKDSWHGWVMQSFREVGIEACAAALGLSPGEILTAAGDDDAPLLGALTLMAARSERLDLLAQVGARSTIPSVLLSLGAFAEERELPRASALALVEALVPPGSSWTSIALRSVLDRIHEITQGPFREPLFDRLLAEADRHFAAAADGGPAALLARLAVLAPATRREALRARAAGLDGGGPAIAWLQLVDQLEKASSHE